MAIENAFAGKSEEIQQDLQGACCDKLCPPIEELEDNQFLAVVYWALNQIGPSIDPSDAPQADVVAAAFNAWCEVNMATFCDIPPDRLKALILYQLNQILVD